MSYVFNYREVLTRKPHKCFGCDREFPSRTYMERQVVRGDNEVYTIHLCSTCQKLIDNLLQEGEEYEQGDFYEDAITYEKEHSTDI